MVNDAPPQKRQQPTAYLLGSSLRERRRAARLSQEALAALVDSTQPRIAHWEKGDDGCGLEMIALLAVNLGCEMHDLMHEEGVKTFTRLAEAIQRAPGAATAA